MTEENVEHLATTSVENQNRDPNNTRVQQSGFCAKLFICVLCRGLFYEPITVSCGHTYCRKCLEHDKSRTKGDKRFSCKMCGIVHCPRFTPTNIGTNVVLSNLIRKWFPSRSRAAELKTEGNKYFEKRDFQRAVTFYSEAISLYDADHLLFSNRSHAYASLQQFDRALEDAEKVVAIRPDWPKGFFRKGNAMYELGRYEEAVTAFLQCLALNKDIMQAKENLSRSLLKILSKSVTEDPKKNSDLQHDYNPAKFQELLNSSFNMETLQPYLSANTWNLLKQIVDGVVTEDYPSSSSSHSSSSPGASMDGDDVTRRKSKRFPDSFMEGDSAELTANMMDKQRCNSVPVLDPVPVRLEEFCQRQRLRSWSPERNGAEVSGRRQRDCHPSMAQQPLSPSASSPQKSLKIEEDAEAADMQKIDPSLLSVEDLECSLCYRLFYQPVTTPCGHTFCRECLDRCLDHQTSCPMCKSSLSEYLAERKSAVTESLQAIIMTYFLKEHTERQQIHEEEMRELAKMDQQHDIPIFVCTLGFPTVLCPLHIFEPRYRLMIRQCMESGTRQFGMCACISDSEEDFSDYGCMLEVRDVHFFPDGRSLVDTVGGWRFRVLTRGKRDGYNTAKVEFIQDDPISYAELPKVQSDQAELYSDVEKWMTSLTPFHQACISQHFGNLPDLDPNPSTNPNGPAWAWWCIAMLPLDPSTQLSLLATCSYRERLKTLSQVLSHLSPSHQ